MGAKPDDGTIRMGGLSSSNSVTIQRNVLGPGVVRLRQGYGGQVGHMLQSRDTNPATWAETVRYPRYDQVGTVTGWGNAAGLVRRSPGEGGTGFDAIAADAFGNRLAAWATGRWDNQAGWLHNTKEYDAQVGLVYMYQRWYDPATGTFVSSAPYSPRYEPPYSFALQDPSRFSDPRGEWPIPGPPVPPGPACSVYFWECQFCCTLSCVYYKVCSNAGNNAWSNCVRGCILATHTPWACISDGDAILGAIGWHAYCYIACFIVHHPPPPIYLV
ncbi:MAG: hypothetical protein KF858_15520 [Candidatus Sumerlaeia bacterium]|nr:hypothetical protein [Candidatus Sumerlaeia bacterium]